MVAEFHEEEVHGKVFVNGTFIRKGTGQFI